MAEILVKAIDHRMPTASEWRAWINSQLPSFNSFLLTYSDVPTVEANQKKLEKYQDALHAIQHAAVVWMQTGSDPLTPAQRAELEATISNYTVAPLSDAEKAKITEYFSEDNPEKASIVSKFKWMKHQVDVEHPRDDTEKGVELALKDRRGAYKAGFPVVVMPDGHTWGNEECPPKFVVIKIPGVSVDTVRHYLESWNLSIKYDIVSSDLPNDAFRIKISSEFFHAGTGEGKIGKSKVETFLTNWGATNITEGDNAVEFDIMIFDALKSKLFWDGLDLTGVTFTELNYTQAGGIHRVRIDYSGSGTWAAQELKIARAVIDRKCTFVSQDLTAKTITLDVTRLSVRNDFQAEVKRKTDGIICRRRRRFAASLVAEAMANGGTITKTDAEVNSTVIDHTTE